MIKSQERLFELLLAVLVASMAAMAAMGFCLQAATSGATARKGQQTPDTLRRAAVCSDVSELLEGKSGEASLNQTYNMTEGSGISTDYLVMELSRTLIAGARY